MTRFLAIDPGLSGAIACLDTNDRGAVSVLQVVDMPTFSLRRAGSQKREVDVLALAGCVDSFCKTSVTLCVIERSGTRPGQSISAAQIGAMNEGLVRGVAAAQFVPIERLAPAAWKRAMGCPSDKDAARARASQLLPAYAHLWPLKKHDGRAEAALMALYAERLHAKRGLCV